MRTTVTLDPDVEASLRRIMRERGISFKEALNTAVRAGLAAARARPRPAFRQPTFSMGFRPDLPLDKALALADALEDEELARRMSIGK